MQFKKCSHLWNHLPWITICSVANPSKEYNRFLAFTHNDTHSCLSNIRRTTYSKTQGYSVFHHWCFDCTDSIFFFLNHNQRKRNSCWRSTAWRSHRKILPWIFPPVVTFPTLCICSISTHSSLSYFETRCGSSKACLDYPDNKPLGNKVRWWKLREDGFSWFRSTSL